MRYDRILVLAMSVVFIIFSLIIRFIINGVIRKSSKRSEENKKKEIRKGNIISIFLFFIALYWALVFIFYNKLF